MIKVLLLLPLLIFAPIAYSQTIETGDSSAKSSVTTEISGNGNIYTKIGAEANGEKKVLETNEAGTHTLEVSAEGEIVSSISGKENSDNLTKRQENQNEVISGDLEEEKVSRNFIEKFISSIADFLKDLFL